MMEARTLGRRRKEEPGRRTHQVRIEAAIFTQAQRVAEERGLDLSEYLSAYLREPVRKDWLKIIREAERAD